MSGLGAFDPDVQPAIDEPRVEAIAGATLCATRFSGKLNGVMKAQGPIGTRLTIPR